MYWYTYKFIQYPFLNYPKLYVLGLASERMAMLSDSAIMKESSFSYLLCKATCEERNQVLYVKFDKTFEMRLHKVHLIFLLR